MSSKGMTTTGDNWFRGWCENDSDGDGVGDSKDLCPGTILGSPVDVNGCPYAFGDFDRDGDVDQADLEKLASCVTGPSIQYQAIFPGCQLTGDALGYLPADWEKDGDIDQVDFGIFQRCFSGENKPADPNCAQ